MMNEVSTIQKIKSIIINIDPQDVLKDAKEYGLEVQTLEDFENKADNYVFIEKLANKYGDVAARYCALSGASSGIGGIATTVTLASVDISNMAAQLYRLNQKIAVLHGFNPDNEIHQEKVATIYLMALGVDAASSATIRAAVFKAAVENTAKKGPASSFAIQIIMAAAKSLSISMSKSTAAKLVPFIGAVIGGGVNYWFAKKAAEKIVLAYKSDYFDRWQMQNRGA